MREYCGTPGKAFRSRFGRERETSAGNFRWQMARPDGRIEKSILCGRLWNQAPSLPEEDIPREERAKPRSTPAGNFSNSGTPTSPSLPASKPEPKANDSAEGVRIFCFVQFAESALRQRRPAHPDKDSKARRGLASAVRSFACRAPDCGNSPGRLEYRFPVRRIP